MTFPLLMGSVGVFCARDAGAIFKNIPFSPHEKLS